MTARRWWPQSLSGRLIVLLLFSLLASHVVGVLILSSQRETGDLHALARRKALDLYVHLYKGVEGLEAGTAWQVLQGASSNEARFILEPAPMALPGYLLDAGIVHDLAPRLGPGATQVSACVGEACAAPRDGFQPLSRPLRPVVLQARRPDGLWLRATFQVEVRTRWWWPASFWLQVSLVPLIVVVALAARGLLKPTRMLVEAAGRVSRGDTVEPLPVRGPREMRELTLAFNRMQQRMRRFVDDRMRMLAAISHDFRTPMTAMRLRVELIDDPAIREPLLRTLRELRSMVDATLQFARDDAGQEPASDADLRELIQDVIDMQRTQGNDVAWADGTRVADWPCRCRPVSIKRMVGNLVDNGVRHGQRVRLGLSRSADGASTVIDIDDEGQGIRPEAREAVFAPFKRLSPEGVERDGAGLGLAIARSCARAHGGDIELLDGPGGRGLRARVVLPL